MGYRTYIGSMPKTEYNKIKSMNKEQLVDFYNIDIDDDGYIDKSVHDYGKCLYELGKYTDFKPPKNSMKPFFKNKELMEVYDENEFYIVAKEFLAYIIDSYKDKITNYYNDMVLPFLPSDIPSNFLNSIKTDTRYYPKRDITFDFSKITQDEQNALFKMIEHMRTMRSEWVYLTPYDLESGEDITSSWKYEYAIFELVRIYKIFDWKRNIMIYYGA